MKTVKRYTLIIIATPDRNHIFIIGQEQEEDLLSLLEVEEEETTEYVTASFKANRVINLHSLENTAKGELDIKISHRFGFISGGAYELWGLDQSTIRIGGDYGITDRWMVGLGRSSYEKSYDGFMKYKLMRQTTGEKKTPISLCVLGTMAIKTLKPSDPTQENYFSNKLSYTGQVIFGRKFSKAFQPTDCSFLRPSQPGGN